MKMNSEHLLNDFIKRGLLKRENIGLDQVRALLQAARKNFLAAKKNLDIDEETCYAMAYAAMLKVARAIIFLHGFRPDDGQQHKTTIAVAGKILGNDFLALIEKFDQMRRKRNQFTYEPLLPLSREEAAGALNTAAEFLVKVKDYLQKVDSQKKLF